MLQLREFLFDERGNSAVEMAILFPIIMLVVMFITDRFILYEGLTATTTSVNEAIRYAIVQDNADDARTIIEDTLEERLAAQHMGWCIGDNITQCKAWEANGFERRENVFDATPTSNLYIEITNDEWCYGHYITVGVRAHKASLFPSYENFRRLFTDGGPIFHTHKYTIKARIESSRECSDTPQH